MKNWRAEFCASISNAEAPDNEPGIEIVAECANGFEAVKACGEWKPDVLFLDIQMPKLDGFEVLELIDPEVAVVFVTAFDQYAMRAFDAAAVDYLLKPFGVERFRAAIEKVRRRVGEVRPASLPEELKNAARPAGAYLERIVVKDGAKVHVIPAGKLDYAEAQDDYVALRSEGRVVAQAADDCESRSGAGSEAICAVAQVVSGECGEDHADRAEYERYLDGGADGWFEDSCQPRRLCEV